MGVLDVEMLPYRPGDKFLRYKCNHCKTEFHVESGCGRMYCTKSCSAAAYHLRRKKSKPPQKHYFAYIHRVQDNALDVCVKFGVEKVEGSRCKSQNRLSAYSVTPHLRYRFEAKHKALSAERECKRELTCSIVSRSDMPDGYTETTYCYNIEAIEAIYRKHGGVRV